MFLRVKEVNYEEFFINFDEIKEIKLMHTECERKWWKLKIYLKDPIKTKDEETEAEQYLLEEDQFAFIKEQVNKYNEYCENNKKALAIN